MKKMTTSALILSISVGLGMLTKSHAEDIDVLLFSAEAGSVSIDVPQTKTYLNEMLLQTTGYTGSSCTSYSQSGVNSLVEASGFTAYAKRTSDSAGGTKSWMVDDFNLAKPEVQATLHNIFPNSIFIRLKVNH